jgi:hypothetical protein
MSDHPDYEVIKAAVREVLAERAQEFRFRRAVERIVAMARSERVARWMNYGLAFAFGIAAAHAIGW